MRIACPGCAATYEVPASRLKPGKQVRCARCGSNWLPGADDKSATAPPVLAEPPEPEAESEAVATIPEITAMDRLRASPALLPSRAPLIGAWMLTALVVVGGIAAAVGWRDALIRVWPPSSRIRTATGPAELRAAQSSQPAQISQSVQTTGKKAE
jgi:predicted Zn finger-like uncharacterized protein